MSKFESLLWAGVGDFGLPLAQRARDCGYRLGVIPGPRRSRSSAQLFEAGAEPYASGVAWDALVLCLPRPSDVSEVIRRLGDDLPRSVVDLSTGDPSQTRQLSVSLAERGAWLVDAAVSGSRQSARAGRLTLFVGTRRGTNAGADALFAEFGEHVFYFGEPGRGHATKLINQLVHLGNTAVIRDGLRLARDLELPLRDVVRALRHASANSAMLERFGADMADAKHDRQFALQLALKDLHLARSARARSTRLPYLELTISLFERAVVEGLGDSNFTAIDRCGH
jgi:3-hydroxyisobutyrate dehydrogenase-like beta-hydroxyacid dehydrogenase